MSSKKSKQEKDKMYAEILDGSLEYKGTALEDLIPHSLHRFWQIFQKWDDHACIEGLLEQRKDDLTGD